MESIVYNVAQKVNPRDVEGPRKYYAVKMPQGEIDVRALSRRISRETMLGIVETTAVIEALLQAVPDLLSEGKTVRLGEFGSFRLTLRSQGAESPEAFNQSLILGPNLIFRAGREFRDKLAQVRYTRASSQS